MIPLILIGVIVSGVLILWWLLKDDSVLEKTEDKANLVHSIINQNYFIDYERLKQDYEENYTWACNKFGVKYNAFDTYISHGYHDIWFCYILCHDSDYYPEQIPKPKTNVDYRHSVLGMSSEYMSSSAVRWMREFIEIIQKIKQNVSDEELDLILKYHKHNLKRKEFSFVFDKCEKYKYNHDQLFGNEFRNI